MTGTDLILDLKEPDARASIPDASIDVNYGVRWASPALLEVGVMFLFGVEGV